MPRSWRSLTTMRIRLTVYKASHIVRNRQGKRERRRVERNNEWVRVERTSAFKELVKRKTAFIILATIIFMLFYLVLPFVAAFTTVLNVKVIGPLTLAYIYAFAQFAMTWILMHLYVRQANKWDDLVDRARVEAADEVEGAR